MSSYERRLGRFYLSPQEFIRMISGYWVRFHGLPPDAEYHAIDWDITRDSWCVVIKSSALPNAIEGEPVPLIDGVTVEIKEPEDGR